MSTLQASIKRLASAREAYQWVKTGYANAHRAKAEGRPVAWVMFGVPLEILFTMGITPLFPENYGALCAAKRVAYLFCEAAEKSGYNKQICSYARTVMGQVLHPGAVADPPAGGLAMPDLLIAPTVICDLRQKWFEDMSRRFNIPVFYMGLPDNDSTWQEGRPAKDLVDLFVSETRDLIEFLEMTTRRKFNEEDFIRRWHWANETWDLRMEIQELRKNRPAPMGSSDYFSTIYPAMTMLGTREALCFYEKMLAEVKDRVANRRGIVPQEKFRLMWCGIPNWFNLGLLNYCESFGGVMAMETNYQALPRLRSDDPYEDLALRYFSKYRSIGVDSQVGMALEYAREYHIDGVVLSYTQSCRPFYIFQAEARNRLQEELGIPCLMLESDMADERAYSEGQVRTRMDAFLEMVMRKKTPRP